jgi:hypothetical protein
VTVLIGSNLTITASSSLIQALGTPSQRITFQPLSSSYYWNSISLGNAPGTNRFKYCDFANAQTAISMGVYGAPSVVVTEVMNCTFTNCATQAIYGESAGTCSPPTLEPIVKNCQFYGGSNGCVFKPFALGCQFSVAYPGYLNARIIGNIFRNLSGTALLMNTTSGSGSSPAVFINNTVVGCRAGVSATDPWDARIQDNIFIGNTNAVKILGSLSRAVSYNDFSGNATNFSGLPGTYGGIIWANRNGTPADALFNIYQAPSFLSLNDFHLAPDSLCIDAGTPDTAYCDLCLSNSPSQGTQFPDLGAYGGPDACNWLDTVPKLAVTSSVSRSNNIISLNWGAIPRSQYQVQYSTNLVMVGTNNPLHFTNWVNFPNGRVLASEKPTSLVVTPSAGQTRAFFRIQSLGRPLGN